MSEGRYEARRPLCGAKTRLGTPCQCQIVPGRSRCRLHGGASTGARTAVGRSWIAAAQWRRWAGAGWRKLRYVDGD